MMERLTIEESEALSIANQLCLHGYFFPVNDTRSLVVKDDSSLYRFQARYYWPWQCKAPDNLEYAIYLTKRTLRNKQRHGLEEYEVEALASLNKNLRAKWPLVTLQSGEELKLSKDRKKGDKIIGDSQVIRRNSLKRTNFITNHVLSFQQNYFVSRNVPFGGYTDPHLDNLHH